MPQALVFHLDDFRDGLTPDAFRVFAILDELNCWSLPAKHSLAQCCASALPGTIDHGAVLRLFVNDAIVQAAADPNERKILLGLMG